MPKHKILRDPENLVAQLDLKRPAPDRKLALGCDLGSTTGLAYTWFTPGVAWCPASGPIYGGQLDLSAGDYDSGAIRFVRMRHFLAALDPDFVAFEDAAFFTKENFGPKPTVHQVIARTARPIELLGSFKCTLATWCEERNIPCIGFPIGTIKKRATGRGNANKEAIIQSANEEFGLELAVEGYEPLGTDNIADAIYCLALGLESYSRGIPAVISPAAEPVKPLPPRVLVRLTRKVIGRDTPDEGQAAERPALPG